MLFLSACGFSRPPHIEPDDAGPNDAGAQDSAPEPGASSCQLTAIGPSIANTNDTITMEGTFADPVTVNFPGSAPVAATVLGAHRAVAHVPASATAGELTVTACGSTFGSIQFRRASFTLGIGSFATNLEQAAGAREYPNLAVPRASHTIAVANGYIYVIGGAGSHGVLNNVERSLINADGTIGRPTVVPDVSLVVPRQSHTSVVIRDQLFVIGGFANGALGSVEHATFGARGALSSFTIDDEAALKTPRQGHASAVVGNYVYVIGGLGDHLLGGVERAVIRDDGSLGTFETLAGVTLLTARRDHVVAVVGGYVYVIGGTDGDGARADVERAPIAADGTLGAFAVAPGVALNAARAGHALEVIGAYVYVIGGVGVGGSLGSMERAPIRDGGELGPFELVSGVSLERPRYGHATVLAGNYIYAVGGSNELGQFVEGERATINASGRLGAFGAAPGVALTIGRSPCTAVVLGRYLYVLGGRSDPTGVERASIGADGSLSSFERIDALTLAHAGYTTAVVGSYLYLLGGDTGAQRAPIGVDGSLGSFEVVSSTTAGMHLTPSATVLDGYLYLVGGSTASGAESSSVERAVINPDGSIGSFGVFLGGALAVRSSARTVIVGNYVYLVGGSDSGGQIRKISRARISASGALDIFQDVPTNTLGTDGPIVEVIGGAVYALGFDTIVQQATIGADRELAPFATVSDVTLSPGRSGEAQAAIGNYVYVLGGASGRSDVTSVQQAILR